MFPEFFHFFIFFFKIMFHHFCFQWCKNFPKNEKLQFSSVFFHFLIIFLNHFSSFLLPVVQKFSKKWKIAIFLGFFSCFYHGFIICASSAAKILHKMENCNFPRFFHFIFIFYHFFSCPFSLFICLSFFFISIFSFHLFIIFVHFHFLFSFFMFFPFHFSLFIFIILFISIFSFDALVF